MDPAIAKELAALREEIESLRAETPNRARRPTRRRPAADERASPLGAWIDQVKELIATMQGVGRERGEQRRRSPDRGRRGGLPRRAC